jgi:DNA primase catalytic subunit
LKAVKSVSHKYILPLAIFLAVSRFPKGMRPSTLEERESFYAHEFDTDSLSKWLAGRSRNTKLAIILGRHTGLVMEQRRSHKDDVIVIDDWRTSEDVRRYALRYLPESLYYDRNRYHDVRTCAKCGHSRSRCPKCYNFSGQQLAFDLDPENIDCPYHGHIGNKMQAGEGLSFCMFEFNSVKKQALKLSEELERCYDLVSVIYSGRGFHVVVDDEEAYALSTRERREISRRCEKTYAIDEWVTSGGARLMRLPLSLNALVSRKCMIIKDKRDLLEFDPRDSALVIPDFLRSA